MDNNSPLIRLFDFLFALVGVLIFFPIYLIIYIILLSETRSPLFTQKRLGKNKKVFTLFKFRTMNAKTSDLPTHKISQASITKIGNILRKTKIDELPQLLNVLKGEMSLVGPRPCLPSQTEIISERSLLNLETWRPGITGLSQINNIDMSNPKVIALSDFKMSESFSLKNYFFYLILTVAGKGSGDNVKSA